MPQPTLGHFNLQGVRDKITILSNFRFSGWNQSNLVEEGLDLELTA